MSTKSVLAVLALVFGVAFIASSRDQQAPKQAEPERAAVVDKAPARSASKADVLADAAENIQPPPSGFVVDAAPAPPAGFVVDQPADAVYVNAAELDRAEQDRRDRVQRLQDAREFGREAGRAAADALRYE